MITATLPRPCLHCGEPVVARGRHCSVSCRVAWRRRDVVRAAEKRSAALTDEQRRVVEDHIRFVEWYAPRVAMPALSADEKIAAGLLGICLAVRVYQPRGAGFSTYATYAIRNEIARAGFARSRPMLSLADVPARHGPCVQERIDGAMERLAPLLDSLPGDERTAILRHRIGGASPHAVAREMGITYAEVCELEARAIARMKEAAA